MGVYLRLTAVVSLATLLENVQNLVEVAVVPVSIVAKRVTTKSTARILVSSKEPAVSVLRKVTLLSSVLKSLQMSVKTAAKKVSIPSENC